MRSEQPLIAIIDTGCANLSSVQFAVQRTGNQAIISDDIALIQRADKVILPGVGSAKHAMNNIHAKGLAEPIRQLTQPVLGFCLGMQLMTNLSQESGELGIKEPVACLGVIPGEVKKLEVNDLRLPHMGWNTLTNIANHPIFSGIHEQDYVYFVHSFGVPVSKYTIATCAYGKPFSAAIAKDNFVGCQFHPERSSTVGQKIIGNFLAM